VPSAVTNANSELIVALELRHRLPGVHAANDGSLLHYVLDSLDEIRKAAEYVDRMFHHSGSHAGRAAVVFQTRGSDEHSYTGVEISSPLRF
jgi:hypothetical protein